jgi:hypothetical protein
MKIRTAKTFPKWLPLPCEGFEISDAIIFRKADPTLIADGVAALREAVIDAWDYIEIASREDRAQAPQRKQKATL